MSTPTSTPPALVCIASVALLALALAASTLTVSQSLGDKKRGSGESYKTIPALVIMRAKDQAAQAHTKVR